MKNETKICGICGKSYNTIDKENNIEDSRLIMVTGEVFMNASLTSLSEINFCPHCFKTVVLRFLRRIKAKFEVHP